MEQPPEPSEQPSEPLAQRLPEYLAVFGVSGGVAILVGLLIGLFSSVAVVAGVGYSLVLLGVVFLLAGGSRGGGYANIGIGAVGVLFSGGRRHDEDPSDPEVRMGATKRSDPRARLRAGLRPEKNPSAFWQVMGGFAYIGAGLFLVSTFG